MYVALPSLIKIHHQAAKPQGFPSPVEPAAVVVFLLSSYESLAPLSLWHCPAFPHSVCLSLSRSVCLSLSLSLCLSLTRSLVRSLSER